jgi:mRNA-degrading endonuclease YafQ of YafQ-DinJ toxin-antitoxin module
VCTLVILAAHPLPFNKDWQSHAAQCAAWQGVRGCDIQM